MAGDGPDAEERSATEASEPAVETSPEARLKDQADPLEEALPLVEALLFAASKPIPLDRLSEAAELPEAVVAAAVDALEAACTARGRGVRLDRVAGGVRLVTRPEYDYPVRRLLGLDGRTKLSMAALETLAIVAYRQPVTGPEVAELRSVNSSSSIRTLLDRKLITTAGRKEVVGTPFLYKTTKEFLVHFGLKGLGDLPKPEELEAIYGLEAPKPDPAQTELFHVDEATGEVEEAGEPEDPVADVAETNDPASEPASGNVTGSAYSETATDNAAENENEAGPAAAPEDERHDG
ncbi:MAG: SMC-Scp complex subunit ScpB [Holophagales bacterium]|nr:SMC-Scp complex subunit ScpB [Holophagales bacterium]